MILNSELRWFHSNLPWKSLARSWATMATNGPDTIHLSVHWHAESGFVVWGVVTTVSDEVYPTCTHVLVPLLSTAWRVSLWECDTSLWKNYKEHLSVPQSFTHMHSIKKVCPLPVNNNRQRDSPCTITNFLLEILIFIPPSADKSSFWSFDSWESVFRYNWGI